MLEVPVYDAEGKELSKVSVDEALLGGKVKHRLLKEAVIHYENNKRQGTAHTKVRSEVAGTRDKMYRQKGTGNARHGTRQANILRGGATQFGPRNNRNFKTDMNKKAKKEAARTALLAKIKDNQVCIVDGFELAEIKTKKVSQMLGKLPVSGSTLIVSGDFDENLYKSSRNINGVQVDEARNINALALARPKSVLFTKDGFDKTLESLKKEGN